jgi:hypothetical protein
VTTPPTDDVLRASLRAASDDFGDLPPSVIDRLDRALAEAPDLSAPPDLTPPVSPRQRAPWWRRRAAMVTAVLALICALGVGGALMTQPWQHQTSPGDAADANAANGRNKTGQDKAESKPGYTDPSEEPQGADKAMPHYDVTYTGHDYKDDTSLEDARGLRETGDKSQISTKLSRLMDDRSARDACLANLVNAFEGKPSAVDFGSYGESPAMVAVLDMAADAGAIVAVGPGCDSGHLDILGATSF